MSLRALRSFIAISRYGTFARAAEVVGLTQSAVSLHIKALEQEFGAKLFDRTRRQPRLTAQGRVALARAEAVIEIYDRIPEAMSSDDALQGRLRLGAIQSALSGPLPDALVALRRMHPGLRVHLTAGLSADLAQRLSSGDLDAAVTTEPVSPHPTDLRWSELYADHFWLLAPPGSESADVPTLLSELPFIRFDPRAWAGRMIKTELDRLGVKVREEMVLDSQDVIVRMVSNGLGVAVVPMAEHDLTYLPITRLPFGAPQLRRPVVLLERQDRPAERLARALGRAVETAMSISQSTIKN